MGFLKFYITTMESKPRAMPCLVIRNYFGAGMTATALHDLGYDAYNIHGGASVHGFTSSKGLDLMTYLRRWRD